MLPILCTMDVIGLRRFADLSTGPISHHPSGAVVGSRWYALFRTAQQGWLLCWWRDSVGFPLLNWSGSRAGSTSRVSVVKADSVGDVRFTSFICTRRRAAARLLMRSGWRENSSSAHGDVFLW